MPVFNETDFKISITYILFGELTISQTEKLKGIYRNEAVEKYVNYELLKSRLLIDAYINMENAKLLKQFLNNQLSEYDRFKTN